MYKQGVILVWVDRTGLWVCLSCCRVIWDKRLKNFFTVGKVNMIFPTCTYIEFFFYRLQYTTRWNSISVHVRSHVSSCITTLITCSVRNTTRLQDGLQYVYKLNGIRWDILIMKKPLLLIYYVYWPKCSTYNMDKR